jgi:ATP-dependent DNA ligase
MSLPLGFIPPCLPIKAAQPPSGELWLHEIKHDGFRIIARKDSRDYNCFESEVRGMTA